MNDFKFGNFLYELRTEKGLSQAELGDMFGVSNKAVSKWEMGISKPRPDMLIMLASFFGVTVDELLAGERNEKEETEEQKTDDTALKIWTYEYRKKKRNGRNAVLTAVLLPVLIFIILIIIVNAIPNDIVVGPIIIAATMFAEAIDIALIFVFYSYARKFKRTLYATYPEKTEEITEILFPAKDKKEKVKVPLLKWEKICSIAGYSAAWIIYFVSGTVCRLVEKNVGKVVNIIGFILACLALIPCIVARIHYLYRKRKK